MYRNFVELRQRLADESAWQRGGFCSPHEFGKEPTRGCVGFHLMKVLDIESWNVFSDTPEARVLAKLVGMPPTKNDSGVCAAAAYVAEWNDDKARTHQEVIALIDRAIKETGIPQSVLDIFTEVPDQIIDETA